MLGVDINFTTGSVQLWLGYEAIGLSPNFTAVGFKKHRSWAGASVLNFNKSRYNQVNPNLWREFAIEDYRRVRPLLLLPYLSQLGVFPPTILVDEAPLINHTSEPIARGFTDIKKVLLQTNLLPLVVSAKSLKAGGLRLKEVSLYPRTRPLIVVLDDEDTLPLHGDYRRDMFRPDEMTPLHELSLLKHWATGIYETINFGDRSELSRIIRLEGQHYE